MTTLDQSPAAPAPATPSTGRGSSQPEVRTAAPPAPRRAARSTDLGPGVVALRARDIAELAAATGYPCISVMLPTTPAVSMTRPDQEVLRRLLGRVDEILEEQGVLARDRLMRALVDQARRAAAAPTGKGLALYSSLALQRTLRLSTSLEPRAIVEDTFATRPLLHDLHRMPPHVVLVLHPTCSHLFAAGDGRLRPVKRLEPFSPGKTIRLPRPDEVAHNEDHKQVYDGYLRDVDRMLGEYRTEHPSPLVLAGTPGTVDRFRRLSRNLDRLAGTLTTGDELGPHDLALECTRIQERYLRSRREDALARLGVAESQRPRAVVAGIEQCWRSVRSQAPSMLLVEESYLVPGDPQNFAPVGAPRPTSRRVVYDLVDDLMEQVIARGGQLALVKDGDLTDHGRIALIVRETSSTLRTSRPSPPSPDSAGRSGGGPAMSATPRQARP